MGRLGRWSILLQGYDFDIVHKSGKSHGNADALSRRQYDNEAPQTPNKDPITVETVFEPQANSHPSAHETYEYTLAYTTDKETVCFIDNPDSLMDQSVDIRARQRLDSSLNQYIEYLEDGTLPPDTKAKSQYRIFPRPEHL